ncbi:hypothetical protein [Brevundimonas sp. UBA2416]|uniref:hypothetical protein n=1 Tax=Brevundimonas sp. UBA2416 TaxID=1946124 RepID=UPI0025C2FC36|nr:hypothetical protein [Brevundimonas sp. UBA2416]HRJ63436.1 hypothetical protein [Brevundimonas sp.]
MKINSRVRDLHEAADARYRRLSEEVKEKLAPRCDEQGWFYRARVKSLESFALKLETGRIENPSAPEDFFACTVVVQTQAQLQQAEDLVLSLFDLHERKPPNDQETYKEASNFVFDDLRLYVRRRESASSRNQDLTGLQFEVQLKTILQYAWGVATHDLVYKTDTVSWPKSRIAFQVKAMLEHAKQDGRTADILKVIAAVERIWPDDALPADRKRLAENIQLALRIGDKKADDLVELVEAERRRVGLLPRNLSPYAFVVQALANSQVVNLERKLERSGRAKLVVHDEMDLPAWMAVSHDRIIHLGRDGQA